MAYIGILCDLCGKEMELMSIVAEVDSPVVCTWECYCQLSIGRIISANSSYPIDATA